MVSYNEALLATLASRAVNPYILGTGIMDTGVPYRREHGFSAPPANNSNTENDNHQRGETAARLPSLHELFPEICDGNQTAVAEVADMGPSGNAGREQRQSSPYRMNGSALGSTACETPFATRFNAGDHVHGAPPAPVHPEHERESLALYDKRQISRFKLNTSSNTFGDRGASHVRGKDTNTYPPRDIRSYFYPCNKQDYVPAQSHHHVHHTNSYYSPEDNQTYHHTQDTQSYYALQQHYGYSHEYSHGNVSRQAQHDNGYSQDYAPVHDHHGHDHHQSSVSRNSTHGWTPINARDSRTVLTPDGSPFADHYNQESPTPAARGHKFTNNKHTAQGTTERYNQPAPKLKLKGSRGKKPAAHGTTKYREIQPKLGSEPKAAASPNNKSLTPRLDALAKTPRLGALVKSGASQEKAAEKHHAPATASVAAPATAPRLHQTWKPAPTNTTKCDICNKRAIGSMIHQRCAECPYVICRNCVFDGKMTMLRNHKVMSMDEFNWGMMRPVPRMTKVRAAMAARGEAVDDVEPTKVVAPLTPAKEASSVTIPHGDYDDNVSSTLDDDYKPPPSAERKSKKTSMVADHGFSALGQYSGHVGLANSRPVRTSSINTYEKMRNQVTELQHIDQPRFGSLNGRDTGKRHHEDSDDEDFESDQEVYTPRKRRYM